MIAAKYFYKKNAALQRHFIFYADENYSVTTSLNPLP